MQRLSKAASKIGRLKRGSVAFRTASASRASAATLALVGGVDLRRREAVVVEPVDERLRPRRVEVGERDPLEEVAPLRHRGDRGADAAGADDEDLHATCP